MNRFILFFTILFFFQQYIFANEIILKPTTTTGRQVGFIFVGRNDVDPQLYVPFGQTVQSVLSPNVSAWFVLRNDLNGVEGTMGTLSQNGVQDFFFVGHSMTDGGVLVQQYISKNPQSSKGLILLSSFLQRVYRPDIAACLPKASQQPERSFKYPLGFLTDGAHNCYGPNTVSFPVPTLTVGGELDGVVRIGRIAEAFYTQVVLSSNTSTNFPVVVLPGTNHANFFVSSSTSLPVSVQTRDLKAEVSASDSRSAAANVIHLFVQQVLGLGSSNGLSTLVKDTALFLDPLIEGFVGQEGNWFFTGEDDEHGSSSWAAQAQVHVLEPLPAPFTFQTANEFRLLSDEERIPPYYRPKHRAQISVTGNVAKTSNICQLRFLEISITDAGFGLNGYAIIKEEKLNVLTAIPDIGADYISAIEIATKMSSRQFFFNLTGNPAPNSLDGLTQCQTANQEAYNWALKRASDKARARFQQYGLPMVMVTDKNPTPSAGPFWIWSYLNYNKTASALNVQSWSSFVPLDGNDYGKGTHYCKLISPARVLEWIYTDSLRDKYPVTL